VRRYIDKLLLRIEGLFKKSTCGGFVVMDSLTNPADALSAGKIVLVGTKDHPKWLKLQCPCGCKSIIALNLMQSHSPKWTVEIDSEQMVSVFPSVHSTDCGAHFWIKRSEVIWAKYEAPMAS
jgi:hypothetical protein